jgi:hypothetical protein
MNSFTRIFFIFIFMIIISMVLVIIYHLPSKNRCENTIIEGLTDVEEINRFKIKNNLNIVFDPYNGSNKVQSAISSMKRPVDDYINYNEIAPATNDTLLKKYMNQIKTDITSYSSSFIKLYFIGSTLPIVLDPFVFVNNELSRQYNYLKMCYPNTIQTPNDYQQLYILLILGQLAKDITNSELNPDDRLYNEENALEITSGSRRQQEYLNYYDYISKPILDKALPIINTLATK